MRRCTWGATCEVVRWLGGEPSLTSQVVFRNAASRATNAAYSGEAQPRSTTARSLRLSPLRRAFGSSHNPRKNCRSEKAIGVWLSFRRVHPCFCSGTKGSRRVSDANDVLNHTRLFVIGQVLVSVCRRSGGRPVRRLHDLSSGAATDESASDPGIRRPHFGLRDQNRVRAGLDMPGVFLVNDVVRGQ